jgi:hypothetical protein
MAFQMQISVLDRDIREKNRVDEKGSNRTWWHHRESEECEEQRHVSIKAVRMPGQFFLTPIRFQSDQIVQCVPIHIHIHIQISVDVEVDVSHMSTHTQTNSCQCYELQPLELIIQFNPHSRTNSRFNTLSLLFHPLTSFRILLSISVQVTLLICSFADLRWVYSVGCCRIQHCHVPQQ